MAANLKIGVLVVGAVLLLAALLSGLFKALGSANPNPALKVSRVVMGLFGATLIVWGLVVSPRSIQPQPQAPTEAVSTVDATVTPAPSVPLARPDLVILASAAFTGCAAPAEPGTAPDGAHASRAQMLAAQKLVKAYDAANTAYLGCLDTAATQLLGQYKGIASPSEIQAVGALDTKIHNAAVDRDQALADRFNRQVRIYKGRL
jgi:hypothetical protein